MAKALSVVIPVYNEEESVRMLWKELKTALVALKKSYEVIFVDDGSTDKTRELLLAIQKKEKNIRAYSFRRNTGKSAAFMLGFKKATGAYIATLDADLQDDPHSIKPLMDTLIKKNYDLVAGWRKKRQDPQLKVYSSKLFNSVVSHLFGLKIHDLNCGLKLYKSHVAKDLHIYGGMHRFIPIILSEMGYRVGEREVIHHARRYGVSKYKFTKIVTDIPDFFSIYFLTRYTRRPLHFFGKLGGALFIIGFVILSYLSLLHFMGEAIGRRPLLFLGILLIILGIQTVFTGLLADLIVNIGSKNNEEYPLLYDSK